MTATHPRQAVILARISDARNGDERGVSDQVKDARALAARLGWTAGPDATHVIVENDTSAYKRKMIALPDGSTGLRTVRPEFRRALGMLAAGAADGLIGYDLDRVARDPRDLEDLIDVIESRRPRVPVESVTGSLRLANDADVTMARIMCSVANKSSRDTGRRVARSHERRALSGEYRGGRRPFGYGLPTGETDDKTGKPKLDYDRAVPAEAAEIKRAADAILAGVSLRSVTAGLSDRGVQTVTGVTWQTRTVRDILLRARNAGISVYRGAEMGLGAWEPILTEDEYRAVKAVLEDPSRRTTPGSAPKWLGSLIYRCGICDDGEVLYSGMGTRAQPTYRCRSHNHLRRIARPLDEMVEAVIVGRLSKPDAADLLTPRAEIDVAAVSREANAVRARMDSLASLFADGSIDARQLTEGTAQLRARLAEAESALSVAGRTDPLAGIAGRPDAATLWAGLDLGRRRAILKVLLNVTVNRDGRGGRQPDGSYFNPDSVRINWVKP